MRSGITVLYVHVHAHADARSPPVLFFLCFKEGGRLTIPLCPCPCQGPYAPGWWPLPPVPFFFFLLKECGGLTTPFAHAHAHANARLGWWPLPPVRSFFSCVKSVTGSPSSLPIPMPTPVRSRVVASGYPFCPLPSCLKSGGALGWWPPPPVLFFSLLRECGGLAIPFAHAHAKARAP